MTKEEIIQAMNYKKGFSKKDSEKALDDFMEMVDSNLKDSDKVTLEGFGTFDIGETNSRVDVISKGDKEDFNFDMSLFHSRVEAALAEDETSPSENAEELTND